MSLSPCLHGDVFCFSRDFFTRNRYIFQQHMSEGIGLNGAGFHISCGTRNSIFPCVWYPVNREYSEGCPDKSGGIRRADGRKRPKTRGVGCAKLALLIVYHGENAQELQNVLLSLAGVGTAVRECLGRDAWSYDQMSMATKGKEQSPPPRRAQATLLEKGGTLLERDACSTPPKGCVTMDATYVACFLFPSPAASRCGLRVQTSIPASPPLSGEPSTGNYSCTYVHMSANRWFLPSFSTRSRLPPRSIPRRQQ